MYCFMKLVILAICFFPLKNHVFSETLDESSEIEFNVLKQNFIKNLLADYRNSKNSSTVKSGERKQELDDRISDFKTSINREHIRRKQLPLYNGPSRKRRSIEHVDDETFNVQAGIPTLVGFEEIGHIPVSFALDICLFEIGQNLHVAALHWMKTNKKANNNTVLTLYRESPPQSFKFEKYFDYPTKNAQHMDCVTTPDLNGLVTIVNEIERSSPNASNYEKLEMGSPVFKITETPDKLMQVQLVQFFNRKNQNRVDLWSHGNDIFLIQTVQTFNQSKKHDCPVFKWSGFHFDLVQELPCQNAVEVQKFTIHQQFYVAFANRMNDEGKTNVFSYVYKLDLNTEKFVLHQRLNTNAANDIRYFYFDNEHVREHFLIVGNSYELDERGQPNYEAHSMIYKFVNGFFTPFQSIQLNYVKKVLPVMGNDGEFVLLIACENSDIQLFQYDGWRFYEASIDYTGAAFERGVSYMRTHTNIHNKTIISIANENLFGEHANLFSPNFELHDDLEAVHASILEWCEENYVRLSQQNLEGLIAAVQKIPKLGIEIINLSGKLTIQRGSIQKMTTESLTTPKGTLDKNLATSMNEANKKVKDMQATVKAIEAKLVHAIPKNATVTLVGNIHVNHFESESGNITDLKVTTMNGMALNEELERIANENKFENITIEIEELEILEGLQAEFLNDFPTASLLHTHDVINLPNLTVHAKDVILKEGLFVAQAIDGIVFTPENVVLHNTEQTLVGTLKAPSVAIQSLDTLNLQTQPVEAILQLLHELLEKTTVPYQFESIETENLTLHGLLNGLDLLALNEITLKNKGDQRLEGENDFDLLITPHLLTQNYISDQLMSNIVRIDNGTFVINQNIKFDSPLEVNDLMVGERINDINVKNGKLDILVKRSADLQIVTGDKAFERLQLMGPISLQGKIRSETLEKMNPISTVDEDLFLEGDYKINGNVTVKRLLSASNIYGPSKTLNVAKLLSDGLLISPNETHVQMPVEFQQHIRTDNLIASHLNNLDPKNFVKGNIEEIQVITGRKLFTQDLTVKHGLCDAEKINGVDLKVLNSTVLKNVGDQEVRGRIHFHKVTTPSVATVENNTKLGNLKFSQLLTTNTEQIIPLKFTINAPVHVTNGVEVLNLSTTGQLFGHTMSQVIADTVLYNQTNLVKINGDKFFESCTFEKLSVSGPNGTFCGVNLENLQEKIGTVENDLVANGTIDFPDAIYVKNLYFENTLNGMRKSEFGTSWLLTEFEQTFTEPQLIENLWAEEDVLLNGLLNGVNFTELLEQIYWLDSDEDFKDIQFTDGLAFQQSLQVDGLVSGIDLSEEVLLNNVNATQEIRQLTVAQDVIVTESIGIEEVLNGVDYQKLAIFAGSKPSDTPLVLKILGNAEFQVQPIIGSINGINVDEMFKNAWFTNDDVVIEMEAELEKALFDKMLYTDGPVNQLSLDYLISNYFSLTQRQEVTGVLYIGGNAIFENVVSANSIHLNGKLRGYTTFEGIDIAEFDKFVLKKNVDQTITAPWHFHFIEITDNQKKCKINDLDLAEDVVRYDVLENKVTGFKQFPDVLVQNTECPSPCFFNDVDMDDWMGNSVLNFGDYTIQGTTVLHNPVFYHNILSLGPVNNITFNEEMLLLKSKDQVVNGNMQIRTKFAEKNRIWMMLFENLHVQEVNGKLVSKFFENVALTKGEGEGHLQINTNLHFLQPLVVEQLQCNKNQLFGVNVSSLVSEFEEKMMVARYEKSLNELHGVAQGLVDSFENRAYYLNHFELRKSIYGSISKVLPVSLVPGKTHLAVFMLDANRIPIVTFHRWVSSNSSFTLDFHILPLPSDERLTITKMDKASLHKMEYMAVETYDKAHRVYRLALHRFSEHTFDIAYQFVSNVSSSVISMHLGELQCIGIFSEFKYNVFINCLDFDGYTLKQQQVIETSPIRQAVFLPGHLILLNVEHKVLILISGGSKDLFQTKQIIHIPNPSYVASVLYHQHRYLAICSEKVENSIHYGMVEIYRSQDKENFHHFQTISIKVPVQAEFSVLPTKELMLYILTNNPTQPIIIYQYAGAAGFKEFIQTSMIPRGQYLQVIQMPELQKEFVALTDKDEMLLIEACMKY